jgi:hypothetical protein
MAKSNDTATPDSDAIAKRAYEIYLQRGSLPGHEVDDWLEAEAQLTRESAQAGQEEQPSAQPVVRRRSARNEAHPPSNRRV